MKKIVFMMTMFLTAITIFAQSVDEVTLVVSGEAETKDKAVTIALRSAIEQAFGVFVSANTTILNDELVKDEIATVSSGNVKQYKELNSLEKEDGNTFITLQATVSVKAMTTYAQSKGAECEFAGATFGQQMKLAQLNKEAEKKAFDNLLFELKEIAPYMFDMQLSVGEPNVQGNKAEVELTIDFKPNQNYDTFKELLITTLIALNQDKSNDKTNSIHTAFSLVDPAHNFRGSLAFYNEFPLKEVQWIIKSQAYEAFVYDIGNYGVHLSSTDKVQSLLEYKQNARYRGIYKYFEPYNVWLDDSGIKIVDPVVQEFVHQYNTFLCFQHRNLYETYPFSENKIAQLQEFKKWKESILVDSIEMRIGKTVTIDLQKLYKIQKFKVATLKEFENVMSLILDNNQDADDLLSLYKLAEDIDYSGIKDLKRHIMEKKALYFKAHPEEYYAAEEWYRDFSHQPKDIVCSRMLWIKWMSHNQLMTDSDWIVFRNNITNNDFWSKIGLLVE